MAQKEDIINSTQSATQGINKQDSKEHKTKVFLSTFKKNET